MGEDVDDGVTADGMDGVNLGTDESVQARSSRIIVMRRIFFFNAELLELVLPQ